MRQIADEWGISRATATKVIAALRSEGLVRPIQGVGTVVSAKALSHAPRDRVLAIRRTGKIYPADEHARIVSAETVEAPEEVAAALGVDEGSHAVRRHRATYRGDAPVSASTSWFAGQLVEVAPRLLETERLPQGTPGYIEEVTGRMMTRGRDQVTAGAASARDAAELGVAEGSPVLQGRNWVYDQNGGRDRVGRVRLVRGPLVDLRLRGQRLNSPRPSKLDQGRTATRRSASLMYPNHLVLLDSVIGHRCWRPMTQTVGDEGEPL